MNGDVGAGNPARPVGESAPVLSTPEWSRVAGEAFDALPSRIAIVGPTGVIVAVNRAWRTFAHLHGASDRDACEGRNFFAVCDSTNEHLRTSALDVATGLRQVLDGTLAIYESEQPCDYGREHCWTSVTISPIRVGANALAVLAYEDITVRKNIEMTLRETERAHDRAQRIARVGSWSANFATQEFLPSREGRELLGWTAGSHSFADLFALVHPDDRQRQYETWMQAIRARTPFDIEHRMTLRGAERWVRVMAEFSYGADGEATHAFGVTQDITEQRRMHAEVTEERARLRTLLDTIPDVVFVKDLDGRYLLSNPAVERLVGMPHGSLVGKTDADIFPPETADQYRRDDLEVMVTGRPFRRAEEVPSMSGSVITVETIKTPMYFGDRLVGVLGIARDVTEVRRVAAALALSEQQKQFALDAAQLGTWHQVPGADIVRLDPRARQLWDVDDTEMSLDDLIRARVHPDDHSRLLGPAGPNVPGRHTVEFRVCWRDGEVRWLVANVQLSFQGESTAPIGLETHGTVQDITDRKRAEEMMARFVSANPALIYALGVVDGGYPVRWFSRNLEALTGWSDEQAREMFWWAHNIHPDDRAVAYASNEAVMRFGHSIQEFRFKRPDGSYFWVRDEKRLLRDSDGRPTEVVGSWSDVTERVALEEQLRQSHKLEAIGLLAGGIAHDFNNLLTVIGGNTDLLKPLVTGDETAGGLLADIRDAGDRAGALTRQLLAFSRTQVMAPKVVSLNSVVLRVNSMLTRLIGEDIRFECFLGETGHVRLDEGQFEQVVLNLAVNARDAMPRGGHLVLRTECVTVDDSYARMHPDLPPGEYAVLSMTDTGSGIPPDLLARIFEPFFSTKEPGRGTGLGLSMAFGIVKQSGGHIDVRSQLNQGSTFTVYLPQVQAEPAAPVPLPQEASSRRGHETVLLVEDEESVRKLARVALERNGYTVIAAPNGLAALELAEGHGNGIDLLVTDVVMPEMRGPDLAHVLRGRRPGLKVLFISGYVQDAIDRVDVSEANFLLKPFSLKDLAEKVRRVLDAVS